MLNPRLPVPLYHQLAEILLGEIRSGVYAPGDRITSEHALAAKYGIGRPTVRQALDSLARRGVLVRRRGSGTFVAKAPEAVDLFSLAGTLKSLRRTGCELDTVLVRPPRMEAVPSGDTPGGEANPFAGRPAYVLCRLSRLDRLPVLVEDIFLHPVLFSGIEAIDLQGQSLSGVVADRFGLALTGGEQQFRIAYPDARLGELLELPGDAPILAVNRFLDFPDAPRAVFSTMHCRADHFVFTQQLGGLSDG